VKKIVVLILIAIAAAGSVKAQIDPHFSQYYAYPLWLNPALTGVFDGDVRVNANAKTQWTGIPGGYKTGGASVDLRAGEKSALGLNIINQAAGTAGWNYFAAYASYSYGISVSADETQKLRFGLQAGIINRSFDPSKLQFDDQYNPVIGFDPTTASFETFATTSATVFDASAGLFYYDGDPQHNSNFFGGLSVAHLTSPKDPFTNGGTITSRLPMRFTAHAGIKIKASDDFDVTPHGVFISQQGNSIKALGVYSELKGSNDDGLILGAMLRLGDAVVADAGYHIQNMTIGVSYDFNTSPLKSATNGQGGFEVSISYIFKSKTNPSVVCPKF